VGTEIKEFHETRPPGKNGQGLNAINKRKKTWKNPHLSEKSKEVRSRDPDNPARKRWKKNKTVRKATISPYVPPRTRLMLARLGKRTTDKVERKN